MPIPQEKKFLWDGQDAHPSYFCKRSIPNPYFIRVYLRSSAVKNQKYMTFTNNSTLTKTIKSIADRSFRYHNR